MKSVKTKSVETAAEFIARWGITRDDLLALNPDVSENLRQAFDAKVKVLQRLSRFAIEVLNVPDSANEAVPASASSQPDAPALLERPEPNPEHDWLTYETRWNDKNFRKRKEAVGYGLFLLPLDDDVEIVASEQLPDILVEAFFPRSTKQEVLNFSACTCRWRKATPEAKPPTPTSPNALVSSRGQSRLVLVPPMIMPYNILANDTVSAAIGTDLSCIKPGPNKPGQVGGRLVNLWTMWETASRSSVVQVQCMKDFSKWKTRSRDKTWRFREAVEPPDPSLKDKPFKLGDRLPHTFSIKTGVRWIGSKPQGSGDPGGGKDYLETNALLASMRSDWVEYVEGKIDKDPKLVILRELLTVTYPTEPPILGKPVRDGYQVRDLSALNPDRVYFPPLSIPFGGELFANEYNQKNSASRKNFTDFWRTAYAEAVGVAKAKLLLRYGLQLTTPNPQNFLLEFHKDTLEPTGTVVIRDIGDAKLHSEVIQQIGLDQSAIQYELNNPKRPHYLPAQTSNEGRVGDTQDHSRFAQYPLNTRFHWHQYSSFKAMYGVENLPEREITTVDWGRAHNRKFVETLAAMLGRPELQLPIYDEEVLQAILADPMDDVPEKFKSIMQDAKAILPKMKTEFGSVSKITPDAWRSRRQQYSLRSIYYCEWALEVFADELLHARLTDPQLTPTIKAKWGKWS